MRIDCRQPDQLRPIVITPHYLRHAEGSVLITARGTRVICAASVEDRAPRRRRNLVRECVAAAYGKVPRATHIRSARDASYDRVSGRSKDLQRRIVRALRYDGN